MFSIIVSILANVFFITISIIGGYPFWALVFSVILVLNIFADKISEKFDKMMLTTMDAYAQNVMPMGNDPR
jgi:hypothetical protein